MQQKNGSIQHFLIAYDTFSCIKQVAKDIFSTNVTPNILLTTTNYNENFDTLIK
jgi:hypothetical protein